MNIVDWKPGSLGIPTFHCQRCMNNWLKKGDLPKDCCEPEDITEGPAMCITFTDQALSEMMVVDGIIGEDGKPVRIKVEDLESIRKLLKRKARVRHKRKQRRRARKKRKEGKRPMKGDNQREGGTEESDGEDESESDCSGRSSNSSEEELLPKLFQKYILKKAGRKHRQKRNGGRDCELASGGESCHAYSTSSFSSASLDSSDTSQMSPTDHDRYHRDKKHNTTIIQNQRRDRLKGYSQEEATSSSDEEDSTFSNESERDSTCSHRHRSRRETKPKLSRQNKSKCSSKRHTPQVSGVEDQSMSVSANTGKWKRHTPQVLGVEDQSAGTSADTGKWKRYTPQVSGVEDQSTSTSADTGKWKRHTPQVSGVEDESTSTSANTGKWKRHTPQVSGVKDQSTSTSANTGKWQNQSKMQHGNHHDETYLPDIDGSGGSLTSHQNGQLTSGAGGVVDTSTNSGGVHLPNIAGASSHSTVTRKQRRSVGDPVHLPQLSQASVQQRTQGQHTHDSHAQLHPRRQSALYHDVMRRESADVTKGSKVVSNSVDTSGSHFPMEDATHGRLLNPAQGRRASQMNPNYASASPGKSPQAISTGRTKIATVREDVHIAASQPKGRLKQARKKKKSQMAHKETPHIRSSDVNEEESTHVTLPLNAAAADKVHVDTQLELQKHRGPPTSTDDGHPKRIGRNIIKKTRKSTDPQARAPLNHNSKDLGYLMEKTDVDAGFRLQKGSATYDRRNSLRTIYSNDDLSGSDSRMIPSSAKTLTTGLLSGRPGTARRTEHSTFTPLTGNSPNSAKFGDAELYSGLGTKFTRGTSAAYQKQPSAPVHKNQVDMPANELQFLVGKTTVLPPIMEANTGGDSSCLPSSTSQAPCQKVDTDSGLEVSTEEECSDDEELLPVIELKPISGLSFTSAYAYSFFSMGAQHRKVYNITRQKALEPVRLGRTRLLRKKA